MTQMFSRKKKTWTLFPPEGQERKYPRSRFGTSGRTVGISRNRRAIFRHFVEIGILYTSFFQVSCPPQLGKKKGNSVFGSPLKRRFFQFYSAFSFPGSDRNLSKLEIKTAVGRPRSGLSLQICEKDKILTQKLWITLTRKAFLWILGVCYWVIGGKIFKILSSEDATTQIREIQPRSGICYLHSESRILGGPKCTAAVAPPHNKASLHRKARTDHPLFSYFPQKKRWFFPILFSPFFSQVANLSLSLCLRRSPDHGTLDVAVGATLIFGKVYSLAKLMKQKL